MNEAETSLTVHMAKVPPRAVDTYKEFNMHYNDGHSLQSRSLVHHTKYINMVAFKSLVKSDS
ncbi:hypothetical protein SLEP1_g25706 [Rubroshorea leprosula]|uniref:Uncharacterized protein n=1 Tax=Rubroshorea leprosula TaxID=152421 RepID=A0AAV5JK07_9ROSI|nr:hypothetical protein SLEP1_g25706 [Rubroshorea leprosula]